MGGIKVHRVRLTHCTRGCQNRTHYEAVKGIHRQEAWYKVLVRGRDEKSLCEREAATTPHRLNHVKENIRGMCG